MVGHGGEFILLENLDKTEMRIYHMTNDLVMPNVIEVAGNRKINFAFSTVDKSDNVYNLLVCTFDAKWNNKCELYPITVLKELNWL